MSTLLLSGLLGVHILAVVLGFLSNQGVFLTRVLLWEESLTEILFVIRHSAACMRIFAAKKTPGRIMPAMTRRAHHRTGQSRKGATRAGVCAESVVTRGSPALANPKRTSTTACASSNLSPGKIYTKKEIKKAYRRLAMIHHPDLPMGSHDDAFVRLDMASDYLMKHLAA